MRVLLTLLVLLAAVPARAVDAPEIRTPHFRFVPDEGSVGLARHLAGDAEGKRHYVLSLLGIEDERTLEVRIGSDDEALSRQAGAGGQVPEWISGLAYGAQGVIVLSARGNEFFTAGDTFVHELAHMYLDTAVGDRPVPRWFHEGFAMLVAEEAVGERLKAFLGAAATGSFLPLATLVDSFPGEPPGVHLAYAQSQLFVHWLQKKSGGEGVKRLVAGLRTGMPFALAFDTTFGDAPDTLFREFTRSADRLSSWLIYGTSAGVIWAVVMALAFWAWTRKRRRAAAKKQMWALQDEFRSLRLARGPIGPPGADEVPGPEEVQ